MPNKPLVSIVIPVYNGSNYVRYAIDSALAQDYCPLEVVVVNDGSTDGGETESICLKYGDKIRYFGKENGGVATALNFAVEKANGEYVSWLSHDDAYFSNKVSRQMFRLEEFKNVGKPVILSCDIETIDENGKSLGRVDCSYKLENPIVDMLLRWTVNGCALLIPKSAFENEKFNKHDKHTQDYNLWFRLIKAGYRFEHLPETLVKSRVHPEQDSQKKLNEALAERAKLEKFAFQLFTEQELASWWPLLRWVKIRKIKAILRFKKAVPKLMSVAKFLWVYRIIAPIYSKIILKK